MRRLFKDKRGNIAITFALALIPMCILAGGAMDFSRAMSAKRQLRDTLDGAALAIAGTPNFTQAQAEQIAADFATANYPSQSLGAPAHVDSIQFTDTDVTIAGSANVPTTMLGLIGVTSIKVTTDTVVQRAGANVEVSLVLDVTGSMLGTRIADLKTAANDFVDIVVKDDQYPYYSKVAIVPYSMAVNVGNYANQVRGAYTNGTCTHEGCQKFQFTPDSNPPGCKKNCTQTFTISNCVTERLGANRYTDASPNTTLLGNNYPSTSNPCLSSQILPLEKNKSTLHSAINNLQAGGSTGGHIGVAWGWYMLSPNFSYLWPSGSQPSAYGAQHTYKTVVIMTDGEYNSVYCHGVIAKDSTSGSGNTYDHINCQSGNGDAYSQAEELCANMKAKGITVYTIGFDIVNTPAAKSLLSNCASSSSTYFLPKTGSELKTVFQSIAKSITQLRIAH